MAADGSYIPANVSRESWINVETEVEQCILTCQDALIVHRVNLPFKLPDAPCGLRTFFRIEGSLFLIGNPHQ